MKNLISKIGLILFFGCFISHAQAFVGYCSFQPNDPNWFGDIEDVHLGVYSKLEIDCHVKNRDGWHTLFGNIKVIGPGLESHGLEGFVLTCPLVSYKQVAKRIHKKGKWGVVGISTSAGIGIVSARAGVGLNTRLAACTVTGLGILGLGASAGVMELEFDGP